MPVGNEHLFLGQGTLLREVADGAPTTHLSATSVSTQARRSYNPLCLRCLLLLCALSPPLPKCRKGHVPPFLHFCKGQRREQITCANIVCSFGTKERPLVWRLSALYLSIDARVPSKRLEFRKFRYFVSAFLNGMRDYPAFFLLLFSLSHIANLASWVFRTFVGVHQWLRLLHMLLAQPSCLLSPVVGLQLHLHLQLRHASLSPPAHMCAAQNLHLYFTSTYLCLLSRDCFHLFDALRPLPCLPDHDLPLFLFLFRSRSLSLARSLFMYHLKGHECWTECCLHRDRSDTVTVWGYQALQHDVSRAHPQSQLPAFRSLGRLFAWNWTAVLLSRRIFEGYFFTCKRSRTAKLSIPSVGLLTSHGPDSPALHSLCGFVTLFGIMYLHYAEYMYMCSLFSRIWIAVPLSLENCLGLTCFYVCCRRITDLVVVQTSSVFFPSFSFNLIMLYAPN